MEKPDDIVGHKTFHTPERGFYHEPLTRAEGDKLWAACKAREQKRAADMPTEQDAINAMFEAWQRLKELGWSEAMYCPKDGSPFKAVEAGSTGIFDCTYDGEWPKGHYRVFEGGDVWPSHPVLFKPVR